MTDAAKTPGMLFVLETPAQGISGSILSHTVVRAPSARAAAELWLRSRARSRDENRCTVYALGPPTTFRRGESIAQVGNDGSDVSHD
mgnify:CR=1 FL=1